MNGHSCASTVALDVSGLVAPEPMERILDALAVLAPQATLQVLIDRDPLPLYRVLDRYGYGHAITARADGRFDLTIRKLRCKEP